jgi:hypothetical protein
LRRLLCCEGFEQEKERVYVLSSLRAGGRSLARSVTGCCCCRNTCFPGLLSGESGYLTEERDLGHLAGIRKGAFGGNVSFLARKGIPPVLVGVVALEGHATFSARDWTRILGKAIPRI